MPMGFTRLIICAREDVVPVSGRGFAFFSPARVMFTVSRLSGRLWFDGTCCVVCVFARVFGEVNATRQGKTGVDAGIDSGNLHALPGRPVHCRPAVAPHVRNRNWSRAQVWMRKKGCKRLARRRMRDDAHGWLEPQAVL